MSRPAIDALFFPLANSVCSKDTDPALNKAYGKVSNKLEDYSRHRRIQPATLRLLDVCYDTGDINPKLYKYIDQLPRGSKQSDQNYSDYKEQIRSIIRRVISAILGTLPNHVDSHGKSLIAAEAPEFLKPVLTLLPRRIGSFSCNQQNWCEAREKAPLSEGGQAVLLALIEITNQFHVDDLETLIVQHSVDIYRAVKKAARPSERHGVLSHYGGFLRAIRVKYSIPHNGRGRKKSVYIDQLPQKLKSNIEIFFERAPHGIESYPDLLACAALYKGGVESLEEDTINHYREAFLNGFGCISRNFNANDLKDLSIIDLMTLEKVERDFGGQPKEVKGNRFVEVYRKQEMNATSDRKRAGFDSANFARFIGALKVIAAFNGIFDLQQEFTEAYQAKLDMHSRTRNKEKKKEILNLEALDKAVTEMRPRFLAIMRERSYEYSDRLPNATRNKINFCLFYVVLVTLRYLGYRQMQIRDCVYGVNIVFAKDGSVTCRWKENQVKNNREIIHPLSVKEHGKAYGIVLEALNTYHNRLYKFAVKRDADKINGQFFLRINNDRRFVGSAPSTDSWPASSFHGWFRRCAEKYLRHLEDLYPHFLRGLCSDWLNQELKVGIEKTADALADTPRTVARHYLNRKAPYDGRVTFDAAEAAVNKRELGGNGASHSGDVERIENLYKERDRLKGQQLREAKSEIKRLRKKLGKYEKARS